MAVLTGMHRSSFAAAAVLLCIASHGACAGDPPLVDEIEATYTYKFAPFVTWPQTANAHSFQICVAGDDSISSLLTQAIAGQRVGGAPIVMRRVETADGVGGCQILFVAAAPGGDDILAAAHGKPILTISAGREHAIIRFVIVENHVRFDIDNRLAAQSGLTISSKLLELAHAVTTAEDRP